MNEIKRGVLMNHRTTFGMTPTWWVEQNRFSTKMGGRGVRWVLVLMPLAAALWAYTKR